MFSFVRAAGFAAAALGLAITPVFADSSLAVAVNTAAPTASYMDHASADLSGEAPEANAVEGTIASLSPMTALQHAAAPIANSEDFPADASSPALVEPQAPARATGRVSRPLTALVDEFSSASAVDTEMECLAGAIYFESKGEPLAGQLAVAEVVINRSRSGRYPATLCGVVKQPSQFSFVRGGRIPSAPKDSALWRKAVAIAHIAINDLATSPAPKALSFHATRVSPRWKLRRVATVGNHIFYR